MSTDSDAAGDAVRFDTMLKLMDRLSARPKVCLRCGSSALATLIPRDFPFTDLVRRAQDQGRVAYASVAPGTRHAPVWRCRACGTEIHSERDSPD